MPVLRSLPRNARKYGLLRYGHGEHGLDLVVFASDEAVQAFDAFVGGIERQEDPLKNARAELSAFCADRDDVYLCDLCDSAERAADRPAMMLRTVIPNLRLQKAD